MGQCMGLQTNLRTAVLHPAGGPWSDSAYSTPQMLTSNGPRKHTFVPALLSLYSPGLRPKLLQRHILVALLHDGWRISVVCEWIVDAAPLFRSIYQLSKCST